MMLPHYFLHSVAPSLPPCFYHLAFAVLFQGLCNSASTVQCPPIFTHPKFPRPGTDSLITFFRFQRSGSIALALQFWHNNPVTTILPLPSCIRRFGSMTQAYYLCLNGFSDLTSWLCLNHCTPTSPLRPWFCLRCFATVAQRLTISVSLALSSKHRRPDIYVPNPYLHPCGSGCTAPPPIPHLKLSGSHAAVSTPQFRLRNLNSCHRPSPPNLRCPDFVGLVPWRFSCGFCSKV